MKTLFKYTREIVIVILVILLILQRECSSPEPCPETKDSVRIEYNTDTVKITGETKYYPVPYHTTDTFWKQQKVDTGKIIKNYLVRRDYKLPISDSNGKFNIFASVQFNEIVKWHYTGESFVKTKTIYKEHTQIIPLRNKVYAGIGIGGWQDKFGAEVSLGLNTKKDHLYTISYDPINTYARMNMYWKIKIR